VSLFNPTAGGIGMARAERLAAAFTVLSEPHRLRIVSLMAQQEWTTGVELEPNVPLSQPTVAYHLKVLRQAGMAEREMRGQFHPHRLRLQAFDELRELLEPWTGDL
jgi:ArsR family transcriptional regulator